MHHLTICAVPCDSIMSPSHKSKNRTVFPNHSNCWFNYFCWTYFSSFYVRYNKTNKRTWSLNILTAKEKIKKVFLNHLKCMKKWKCKSFKYYRPCLVEECPKRMMSRYCDVKLIMDNCYQSCTRSLELSSLSMNISHRMPLSGPQLLLTNSKGQEIQSRKTSANASFDVTNFWLTIHAITLHWGLIVI